MRLKSRKPDWRDNISTYYTIKERWKNNGIQKSLITINLLTNRVLSFQDLTFQGESGRNSTDFDASKKGAIT